MKNALPPGRALDLNRYAAEVYYNTDSVVYYDSRLIVELQERMMQPHDFLTNSWIPLSPLFIPHCQKGSAGYF